MTKRLLVIVLASFAAHAEVPHRVVYRCEKGPDLVVEYAADGKSATVSSSDTPPVTLPAEPAGSGFRYRNAQFDLRGKGDEVTWTIGRRVGVKCTTPSLEKTRWTMATAELVLDPSTHRVSGSGGCNALSGGYTLDGEHLSFGPLATTKKFCADVMDQEQSFLRMLADVRAWRITEGQLELLDKNGAVLATLRM